MVAAEAILSGLPVASRRSGGVPWIVELSGGFGAVAAGDDAAAFAAAIETVLDRRLAVSAEEARTRLVATVGAAAVATRMIDCYREAAGRSDSTPPQDTPQLEPVLPASSPAAGIPGVLVATERIESFRRVAQLPRELQERVVLVVPPRAEGAAADTDQALPGAVRLVEAAPVRHERRPRGRSPVARFKRARWRPPLTADEQLGVAIRNAVAERRHRRELRPVVALDAPAAVLIAGLDPRRVRLAPGSLRWLADRWDGEPQRRDR